MTWFGYCSTSRKVAGSIAAGVIDIFYCLNPSGRTVDMVYTQSLTEMSTTDVSWGIKAAGPCSLQS